MIRVTSTGDFKKTRDFLERVLRRDIFSELDRYGKQGVAVLSKATPVDSGYSSISWAYRVIKDRRNPGIEWYNNNIVNGTPVVILIQYGHATGTGGYVPGRDFINPAMRPIFDKITDEVWKKVIA